jgi:hypothetical protein
MSSILRAQNVDSLLYAKTATYLAKDKCTTYCRIRTGVENLEGQTEVHFYEKVFLISPKAARTWKVVSLGVFEPLSLERANAHPAKQFRGPYTRNDCNDI